MKEKIKTITQTLMAVVVILFGIGIYTVVEGAKEEKAAILLEEEVQEVVDTLEAITKHTLPNFERENNQTFIESTVACVEYIYNTTTDTIPNKEIAEIMGVARGSTVRARNIGRDIFAGLKNIVGGEISEYTKLQAESREQAMQRMVQDAERMGADAIVNMRLTTSMVMQGASEILAYGTAIKLR